MWSSGHPSERAAPASVETARGLSASSALSHLNQSPDMRRAPRFRAEAVPPLGLRYTRMRSA